MLRVRVIMQTTGSGGPYLATHYFSGTGVGTEPNDAVDAVAAFWGAVDAVMANNVSWATDPDVATMTEAGVITGFTSVASQSGVGALSTEQLPFANQILVRWRTSTILNGRRLQGRTFIPGLTEESLDDGRVLASTRATVNAAAAALVADADAPLVIWSETNSITGAVISGTAWEQFAQLRKRRD